MAAPSAPLASNLLAAVAPEAPALVDPPVDAPMVSMPPAPAAADGTAVHAEPAALWRRLLASLVDAAVVGGVVGLYLLVASAIAGPRGHTTQMGGLDGLMARAHALERVLLPALVLGLILALAYSAAFGFLWEGRTPGRRLLGIRLVDQTGMAPPATRAVVRALLSVLSAALFLGGFWLALFDRKGQTLHDKLTSTFVIRPRPT